MIKIITLVIQVAYLFLSRWFEIDKEKREKKKQLTREVGDAFKEKDKSARASRLNAVVDKHRRL